MAGMISPPLRHVFGFERQRDDDRIDVPMTVRTNSTGKFSRSFPGARRRPVVKSSNNDY